MITISLAPLRTPGLRTRFERIIRRAGLEPWPKLFDNLRAARETELADTYPIHVVCEWIGDDELVAKKHYLRVTDDHFADAAKERGAQSGALAAQNQAQHTSAHLSGIVGKQRGKWSNRSRAEACQVN